MSDEIARLKIVIDGSQAGAASSALTTLTASGISTEKTLAALLATAQESATAQRGMAAAVRANDSSLQAMASATTTAAADQRGLLQALLATAQGEAAAAKAARDLEATLRAGRVAAAAAAAEKRKLTQAAREAERAEKAQADAAAAAARTVAKEARDAAKALKAAQSAAGDTSGFDRLISKGIALVGVYQTLRTAARFIGESAEVYNRAGQRLALYTTSAAQSAAVQKDLLNAANATGTSFAANIELYSRLASVSKQLGASQQTMAVATKAVSAALAISGATASEAASASTQLSQALASGRLQGDELRALTENAPRLTKAIADGLGVSTDALRKLGAEGELTSKKVFAALLSQTQTLALEMEKLPKTVSQGWTIFTNSAGAAVAALDKQIGASRWLVKFLMQAGDVVLGLTDPEALIQERSRRKAMPKTATQAAEQINEASTALAQISARQTENTIALAKARQDYLNNVRGSTIELRRLKEEQEDLAKFSAGWRGTRQAGFDFFAAGGGINPAFAGKDAPKPATASETRRQAAEAQAAAKAAAREDIADQQERLDMLKDYRELLNNIHDDATKRGKRPGEMPGISVDLPDMDEVKRLQSQADSLTALAKAETRAEATAQALANGLQRSIADGITNGFLDGAKSFAAFGENLKRTIISAISESIANDLVVSIMGGREGGGLRGLMSGLGGLFGKKGAAAGAAQAGAASTAATTGGVASFGGIGLGLAGLGIFAGSQILNLFKPDKNQGYGTFMPGQSITPQAEVARAGTYNAPSGFNAGAYRFEAGRPSNTNVTGNTIVVTLPEGTPREQAEAMLREFERLARAQGLPAGTLPTSQG